MNEQLLILVIFFILSLFFSTISSTLKSLNKLRLELDRVKYNFNSKILLFISKNTKSIQIIYQFLKYAFIITLFTYIDQDFPFINNLIKLFIFFFTFFLTIEWPAYILGKTSANRFVNITAPVIVLIYILILPLYIPIHMVLSFIFGKKTFYNEDQDNGFNKSDLDNLVNKGDTGHSNQNSTDEVRLIKNALEFSDTKLRECMVPRPEIEGVEIDDSLETIKQKFITAGHTRLLVYKDSIDNIVGYLNSKILFTNPDNIWDQLSAIENFPDAMHINKLLKHFVTTGQNIAVILDEFGGTSGIITIEDIIEEIFGEIDDEYDIDQLYERQLNNNEYVFSARLEVDYINDKYHLDLPKNNDYETLAGLILAKEEKIPSTKEKIEFESFNIHIIKATKTKIELIKLTKK